MGGEPLCPFRPSILLLFVDLSAQSYSGLPVRKDTTIGCDKGLCPYIPYGNGMLRKGVSDLPSSLISMRDVHPSAHSAHC